VILLALVLRRLNRRGSVKIDKTVLGFCDLLLLILEYGFEDSILSGVRVFYISFPGLGMVPGERRRRKTPRNRQRSETWRAVCTSEGTLGL
jgi:hypothetical protein